MQLDTLPLVFDRESATAWSQAVLRTDDVVFLDTETTGLDGNSEIIEIAVIDRNGSVLVDTYINPNKPIPFGATAIHGIHDHDVASSPTWNEIFPTILSACQDRLVIVYNSEYDFRLIQQTCRLTGIAPFMATFRCAMQAYACFYAGYASRTRPKYQKLEAAARAFALDLPSHRALGDARACLGVVRGMADAK